MRRFAVNKFYCWLLIGLLVLISPAQPLIAATLHQDQAAQSKADTLMAKGTMLFQAQSWQEALKEFAAACRLYQQAGAQRQEATCWQAVGQTQLKLNDPTPALTAYQTSVALWQALGDPFQEVISLSQMGGILHNTHQYDAAEQVYEQLLPVLDRLLTDANRPLLEEEKAGLGNIYNNMARFYSNIGQYELAFESYLKALEIHVAVGNYGGSAATLDNIGVIYSKWGRYSDALVNYEVALNLAQQLYEAKLDSGASLLSIWGNMGVAYAGQGNFQEALKLHQQALDLAQQIGDKEGEEANLLNLGLAFNAVGEREEALAAFEQARRIAHEIDDWQGEAAALNNIADIYRKSEEYANSEENAAALDYYQQALALARDARDRRGEGIAYSNIGQMYTVLQQYDLALENFEQALAIAGQLGNHEGEAVAWNNLGHLYYASGSAQQALDHFQQALDLAQHYNLRLHEGVALNNIAKVQKEQGQTNAAIASLQDAIAAFEAIQRQLTVESLLAGYAEQQATAYQRLVAWLWEDEQYSNAFAYAERARAQAFLNQMRGQVIDFSADVPLLQTERTLLRQITGLQIEQAAANEQQPQDEALIKRLNAEIAQAQAKHVALLTRIKIANPEYAALITVPDPIALSQVRNQVLDGQTTLIEYFVTDEQVLAWVVDRRGIQVAPLNITANDLRAQIDDLRTMVANTEEVTAIAGALYDVLVAPLAPYLVQPNLIIVPHDKLHYLPFAALWNQQTMRYLIQDYTITYAPSATVLPLIYAKRNANAGRLLALGNPNGDLVDAEGEVEAIANLYGTAPFIREAASEGQVYAYAGQLDILHLSAHGNVSNYNPLFSAIELAADEEQDGKLAVHELYRLHLQNANLVVLSACETALGEQSRGDELVGLTRAFLYAGTPSVMTTLWSVQADTTADLMIKFYTELHNGDLAATALQKAQIALLNDGYSPYHWASFTLTGDYRGGDKP